MLQNCTKYFSVFFHFLVVRLLVCIYLNSDYRYTDNMDARVKAIDDSSTSPKNLGNFGPVTHDFRRRVCAGQATYTLGVAIFSERTTLRSLYAIGRPSVCLSVCCLSVCL